MNPSDFSHSTFIDELTEKKSQQKKLLINIKLYNTKLNTELLERNYLHFPKKWLFLKIPTLKALSSV